jgi:hypothetical protein
VKIGDTVRIRLDYCNNTPFKHAVIERIHQGMVTMRTVNSNAVLTVSIKGLEIVGNDE